MLRHVEDREGLLKNLFHKQWNFVVDPSPRKTALCSRRAGKTFACATYLIETAKRYTGVTCVYIALTRLSAKRIIWAMLKDIARKADIKAKFHGTELTVTLENGSTIWLVGCDEESHIDKLRGSAYKLVIIDEAASFGEHLDGLVDEVLDPALVEQKGTLCMIGTPSSRPYGKFYTCTQPSTPGWTVHSWTIRDNPHIEGVEEWLAKRKEEEGWDDEHPVYCREWLGKWVIDDEGLVIKVPRRNIVQTFPDGLQHVLGVDLGYNDATAFQIASASPRLAGCYLHSGYKTKKLDVTAVAENIQWYVEHWGVRSIVADHGGIGKMLCEELKRRWGLPVKAAEKSDKHGAIELLNGDLHAQKVYVLKGEPVLKEWRDLRWDDTRKKEDPRYPNDLSDAAIYAYRECYHWMHRPEPKPAAPGSDKFWQDMEQEFEDEAENPTGVSLFS